MGSCIHFPDDENANCSLCNKPTVKADSWETLPGLNRGIVEAEYGGTCMSCGGSIIPGDLIRRSPMGWRHIDCRDIG